MNLTEPYEVTTEQRITVCAWCFPGETIYNLFPDLRGVQINHGMCQGHAELSRRQIAAIRADDS